MHIESSVLKSIRRNNIANFIFDFHFLTSRPRRYKITTGYFAIIKDTGKKRNI
jgi:hypothetical protein